MGCMQQRGEVCDGILVQALLRDASKLECWSTLRQRMFLFAKRRDFSADTCAAGVATQSTDVLALVMRFCVQLPA